MEIKTVSRCAAALVVAIHDHERDTLIPRTATIVLAQLAATDDDAYTAVLASGALDAMLQSEPASEVRSGGRGASRNVIRVPLLVLELTQYRSCM